MTGAGNASAATGEVAGRSRFPRWLVAVGIGVPLALILLAASPLGTDFFYVVIGIPALLLAWAIAGVGALVVGVRSAMRKDWIQFALASLLPVVLIYVALDPIGFVRSSNYLGDLVHFIVMKPYYDKIVAGLPVDQRRQVAVFDWGGMVWASFGVVYDESDQVSLPPDRRSADWLERTGHTELSCEGYGARPLWDHYYLVSFPC